MFTVCSFVFKAKLPEKRVQTKACEKMQLLQKAKITVIYSQDIRDKQIMLSSNDDNTICLSLFRP